MLKKNKHALIAARKHLVARNFIRFYAGYKKQKELGLTTLRFAEWLKND